MTERVARVDGTCVQKDKGRPEGASLTDTVDILEGMKKDNMVPSLIDTVGMLARKSSESTKVALSGPTTRRKA